MAWGMARGFILMGGQRELLTSFDSMRTVVNEYDSYSIFLVGCPDDVVSFYV